MATYDNESVAPGPPEPGRLALVFGIDLRSMALFRICLSLFILLDLAHRSRDLTAHYTWAGVIPRELILETRGIVAYLLPHFYAGAHGALQAGCFLLHALVAVALLVGYRTRIATALCWYLGASLQLVNMGVEYGGDVVLRLCLFWSLILPLGACYSVDRAMDPRPRRTGFHHASAGTFAYLIQICLIYLFAALFKQHSGLWIKGEAVRYALHYDCYVTAFGRWIRDEPILVRLMTWGTLALEALGPFLLFVPFWHGPIRMLTVLAFIGLHVGFILTLNILLFPYISIVCWLPFIPRWFWQRLFARLRTPVRTGLVIHAVDDTWRRASLVRTFLLLPETAIVHGPDDARTAPPTDHRWMVTDHTGRHRYGADAVGHLLRCSPLAFWLAPLARWRVLRRLGSLASHRNPARRSPQSPAPAGDPTPIDLRAGWLVNALALVALAYVVVINVESYGKLSLPESVKRWNRTLMLHQHWSMFKLSREVANRWHVMAATLADGRRVDLLRDGATVRWAKPESWIDHYGSSRVHRYLEKVTHWAPYAAYVCRQWDDRHDPATRVTKLEVYLLIEPTTRIVFIPAKKFLLHTYAPPTTGASTEGPPHPEPGGTWRFGSTVGPSHMSTPPRPIPRRQSRDRRHGRDMRPLLLTTDADAKNGRPDLKHGHGRTNLLGA